MNLFFRAVLPFLFLAGCARDSVVLTPNVTLGPASGTRVARVLALKSSCGSAEYRCPRTYGEVVDGIVRGDLEQAGLQVVEASALRKDEAQRHEERTSSTRESRSTSTTDRTTDFVPFDSHATSRGESTVTTDESKIVLDGATFDDLTPAGRKAVIAQVAADSVLTVRIVVGGQMGTWVPNQNVEVMVKLSAEQDDAMVWASRCTASSGQFSTVGAALEHATRCAMQGALRR